MGVSECVCVGVGENGDSGGRTGMGGVGYRRSSQLNEKRQETRRHKCPEDSTSGSRHCQPSLLSNLLVVHPPNPRSPLHFYFWVCAGYFGGIIFFFGAGFRNNSPQLQTL